MANLALEELSKLYEEHYQATIKEIDPRWPLSHIVVHLLNLAIHYTAMTTWLIPSVLDFAPPRDPNNPTHRGEVITVLGKLMHDGVLAPTRDLDKVIPNLSEYKLSDGFVRYCFLRKESDEDKARRKEFSDPLARVVIDRAVRFPYVPVDNPDDVQKTALGILADLTDRRGIRHELQELDDDVRLELFETMTKIIRTGMSPK